MVQLPVLEQMLGEVFSPKKTRKAAKGVVAPVKPASHFQVYTAEPGTRYRQMPAYCGEDQAEAERVAAAVGGNVKVVAGRWAGPAEYAAGLEKVMLNTKGKG